MHDIPEPPAGLPPVQAAVFRAYWQERLAGRPHGGPILSRLLGVNAESALRVLRQKGLIAPRPLGNNQPQPLDNGAAVAGASPEPDGAAMPPPAGRAVAVGMGNAPSPLPLALRTALKKAGGPIPLLDLANMVDAAPRRVWDALSDMEDVEEAEERWRLKPPPEPVFPAHIKPEEVGYPVPDAAERIRALEMELAELRRANEWLTHSDAQEYRGGTLTLDCSDFHYHDRGFLLETARNLEDKVVRIIERFRPRRFIGLLNGDIIPGQGIYRNQQLDNVLPRADQQIAAGVFRFAEFDAKIAAFADMEREWLVLEGNHDWSRGEPTTPSFVWGIRQFGVPAKFVGTEWVQDIADAGGYCVLVEHGYGNSSYNPTSNKMIFETLRKIVGYQNRGYVQARRIRRVLHGHTHFLAIGIGRAEGVEFDTTGGLHRNDRANIGRNTRPLGWIVYLSPPGSTDILSPMAVQPDPEPLRRDMEDPELAEKNRADAARCLQGFAQRARELGIMDDVRYQEN